MLTVKCLAFNWFRVYQGWNRHVTFHDLFLLVQAATASSVLLALSDYLLLPHQSVPRSVFLMDWGATIVCIGGLRALLRFLLRRASPVLPAQPRSGADRRRRRFRRSPAPRPAAAPRHVVRSGRLHHARFANKLGSCIAGVRVLGTVEQTCQLGPRARRRRSADRRRRPARPAGAATGRRVPACPSARQSAAQLRRDAQRQPGRAAAARRRSKTCCGANPCGWSWTASAAGSTTASCW